jgi:hypothetical protein
MPGCASLARIGMGESVQGHIVDGNCQLECQSLWNCKALFGIMSFAVIVNHCSTSGILSRKVMEIANCEWATDSVWCVLPVEERGASGSIGDSIILQRL